MPCLDLSLGSEAMVVRNSVMGGLMGCWVEGTDNGGRDERSRPSVAKDRG